MKKQFTTFLILIFILGLALINFSNPLQAYAYPGQYPWDPLHIEIEQDPIDEMLNNAKRQRNENTNTANYLKSQYGINAFYNCYPCTYKDTSNPSTETSCLLQTQYCLERKQIFDSTTNNCFSGYTYYNGKCYSHDEICKAKYGVYSLYDEGIDGKYYCACENGYEWQGIMVLEIWTDI